MRLRETVARVPRRVLFLSGGILMLSVVYFMTVPLLALYLSTRLHSTPTQIGAVLSVMAVAQQGLQVFIGVLAERWGARTILGLGVAIICPGYLGFALGPPFPLQLVCGLAVGVGAATVSLLGKVMLADAAGGDTTSAFALRAVAVNAGAATGPIAGAVLFGWFEAALLATVSVYVLFWCTLVRAEPRRRPAGDAAPVSRQLRDLAGNQRLLGIAAMSTGFWYLYTQFTFTFPLYANDRFHLGGRVGVLFAVEAVISVALQYPVIAWLRGVDSRRTVAVGCLGVAVAFAVPVAVQTVWGLLVFVIAFALGSILVVPVLDVLAAEVAPGTVAAALGVASLGWAAGGLAGNLLGGVLYEHARDSGAFGLFWLVNAGVGAVTAVAFLASRPVRVVEGA
jgi:DHA1 family multidrug resistance protein-like MFS transporter